MYSTARRYITMGHIEMKMYRIKLALERARCRNFNDVGILQGPYKMTRLEPIGLLLNICRTKTLASLRTTLIKVKLHRSRACCKENKLQKIQYCRRI